MLNYATVLTTLRWLVAFDDIKSYRKTIFYYTGICMPNKLKYSIMHNTTALSLGQYACNVYF